MPARSIRSTSRSVQGYLGSTFFNASADNRRTNPVQSHGTLVLLFVGILIAIFAVQNLQPLSDQEVKFQSFTKFMTALVNQDPAVPKLAQSDKKFDIVYNPPFALSSLDNQQRQVFDLIDDVPNHPERYHLDLLGLASIGLDYNQQQVFDALGPTEGSMRQFNADGSVVTSESGCLGALQGCDFNICPEEFWRQLYTNIWCGAKAFQEQLRMWDGNFTYAIAGYKSAWQYSRDADGNHILDENGNWIILRDDAGNPKIEEKYQEQVDRVFNTLTFSVHH